MKRWVVVCRDGQEEIPSFKTEQEAQQQARYLDTLVSETCGPHTVKEEAVESAFGGVS